jgi:ABC-type uncharacterized transport system involved in gliding motility auxiliary subunit
MIAMRTPSSSSRRRRRRRGSALAMALHAVALAAVLGQVVFLGSRWRARLDTTSDRVYSLTESTRRILDAMEHKLVIEAYLSPKADLPVQLRETRTVLENFLDELVQLGKGKVVVQKFNPLEDKAIQDKCQRIGVKPFEATASTTNALEVRRHWQGLRLLYGGERQRVIEKTAPQASFQAEAEITPAIKDVVTKDKKKLGFMEWPSEAPAQPGQPPRGNGWDVLRGMDSVTRRYDFQSYKDAEGTLVPDDVDTLFLFRPKDLTDRQKYVIDQFLMRGGTLVVFADVADYAIGPKRTFVSMQFALDDKQSELKFRDQLRCYGVDLKEQIVADIDRNATSPLRADETFGIPTQLGVQPLPYGYPYFFHPVMYDWAREADRLAARNGQRDDATAAEFRKRFRPGVDTKEFLFSGFTQFQRAPCFYWPCWTDLRRKGEAVDLPAGVEGNVLLWSSPVALVEAPPHSLDPFAGADAAVRGVKYQEFLQKFNERLNSEPRQQAPLMVDLHGTFPSFFEGRQRPKRPAEIKEEEAKKKAEEEKKQAEEEAKKQAEAPKDEAKPDAKADARPDAKPDAATPQKQGPEPPKKGDDKAKAKDKDQPPPPPVPPEAEQLTKAKAVGRIVVVGDADFLRDDFVRADYQQLGGPVSVTAPLFFGTMLDWLSRDSDLIALYARQPVDRKLQLIDSDPGKIENPVDAERHQRAKSNLLIALDVAIPCLLVLGFGAAVWLARRAQKQAFLATVGN